MNEIYLLLGIVGGCLCWTAWREHMNSNFRDRTLLAACGVTLTAAATACTVLF